MDTPEEFTVLEFVRVGAPAAQKQFPSSPAEHVQPSQEETFEVRQGLMGYFLHGKNGAGGRDGGCAARCVCCVDPSQEQQPGRLTPRVLRRVAALLLQRGRWRRHGPAVAHHAAAGAAREILL